MQEVQGVLPPWFDNAKPVAVFGYGFLHPLI